MTPWLGAPGALTLDFVDQFGLDSVIRDGITNRLKTSSHPGTHPRRAASKESRSRNEGFCESAEFIIFFLDYLLSR